MEWHWNGSVVGPDRAVGERGGGWLGCADRVVSVWVPAAITFRTKGGRQKLKK